MAEPRERIAWPPRLVGALFEAARLFGGRAFLPFGSLTVLLGANGAGKTRTLHALQRGLPALASTGRSADEDDDLDTRCIFFVDVTSEQLETLANDALAATLDGPISWPYRRPAWHAAGRYAAAEQANDGAAGAWLRTVAPLAPPDVEFDDQMRGALLASSLIAVRQASDGTCNLAWCLGESAAVAAGLGANSTPSETGRYPAPVPVVPLGTAARVMLPTAVAVPRDLDDVRRELRDATLDILFHLRWGERERWATSRGVHGIDKAERRSARAWLADPEADTVTVEPSARALCSLASRLATELAPPLVSETHRVAISVEPFYDWDRGGPRLALDLWRGPDVRFPLHSAADGYRVWLQLALLEAVVVLRRYLALLERLLDEAIASSPGRARATRDWKVYDATAALLERFSDGSDDNSPLNQFLALRNVGHRLYLIDEPEQHLHPRLQRSAARWLSEAGTAGASQCVVVTHSPHYLRIPGNVAFAYLQRVGTGRHAHTVIRGLTPQLLSAADQVASEMGFDRGELINSVSAIVFVEGEADKRFLEAFCGKELHHAGVLLIPIHGAVQAQRKGLVDSEIVLSITSAQLGVLLDNLVADEWLALQADPELCRETARSSKKTELKAMAEILTRAQQVGRAIEPLGIPVADIFDLLDVDLLCKRFPSFPGHAAARIEWEFANKKQRINWKAFYLNSYGILVEPELFGLMAAEMAVQGIRPAEVNRLVGELVELAQRP